MTPVSLAHIVLILISCIHEALAFDYTLYVVPIYLCHPILFCFMSMLTIPMCCLPWFYSICMLSIRTMTSQACCPCVHLLSTSILPHLHTDHRRSTIALCYPYAYATHHCHPPCLCYISLPMHCLSMLYACLILFLLYAHADHILPAIAFMLPYAYVIHHSLLVMIILSK